MAAETYNLPSLPYELDALQPCISKQIMDLHYNKHHRTYITNLNNALNALNDAVRSNNLVKQIELQPAIRFNAGGHINHTLFWENLIPQSGESGAEQAAPKLSQAVSRRWGSFSSMQKVFETTTLGIQGSGWTWLVRDADSDILDIVTSKDQDLPPPGKLVVFGVDMWEHAYYLDYLNNKKGYLEQIWKIINWKCAEKRYTGSAQDIYGSLVGLASKM